MKKFIIAVAFIFASIIAYSQESGWINNGEYLEQKFKLSGLQKLHLTKNSEAFYTYHNPNKIILWDIESGKIINSFDQKIHFINFCSDDYISIIAEDPPSTSRIFPIYQFKLINFQTKEIIKNIKDYDIYKSLLWNNINAFALGNFKIYNFDYNFNDSTFYLNYQLDFEERIGGGGTSFSSIFSTRGGCGTFKCNEDFYYNKNQYSNIKTNKSLKIGNKILIINEIYEKTNYAWGGSSDKYSSFLSITNDSNKLITYLKVYNSNINDKPIKIKPFKDLFYLSDGVGVSVFDSNIFYFDIYKEKIIDTLFLHKDLNLFKINNNNKYIIAYNSSKSTTFPKYFYYYNLESKQLIDSIPCFFNATNFELVQRTDKIIAWDNEGNIHILNGDNISNIFEKNEVNNILIKFNFPNPFNQQTNFEFKTDTNCNYNLIVTDIFGNNVYKSNGISSDGLNKIVFQRNNLPLGIYFCKITCGNNIYNYKLMISE